MSPAQKDPERQSRAEAARLIDRRLRELLDLAPSERPDLAVFCQALVTELMTQGWRPTRARRHAWSPPPQSSNPATPAQVSGYADWARRRLQAARNTEEEQT